MSKLSTSATASSSSSIPLEDSFKPTLRVMRLQSPQLHTAGSDIDNGSCILQNSLCLPDSLGVCVGETFTAYLGVLNPSAEHTIQNLSLNAQLQTPTQRWTLGSSLSDQVEIPPYQGVDSIVTHPIDEEGQHILRVEVSYQDAVAGVGTKSFRKFYRFQVNNPFSNMESTVIRDGDGAAYVQVKVQLANDSGPLVVAHAAWETPPGLDAARIQYQEHHKKDYQHTVPKDAAAFMDTAGYLEPGDEARYLFSVKAVTEEAILKGIAAGDLLGRAVFTWRKAMGETGKIQSSLVHCPPCRPNWDLQDPNNHFVVYKSGLAVDVAASAAKVKSPLVQQFPVTVDPIDPPAEMKLHQVCRVQFLVVNHTDEQLALQLQFHLEVMQGLAIVGRSFMNLGEVAANGGSVVATCQFLPLTTGLLRVQGCCVVDLATGTETLQPPLFVTYVPGPTGSS